jgi:alanyl-tRNA synthetase
LLSSKDIRNSFINFFKEKGHTLVPSSPVVPYDDPTLLFTNAGMNQFKDVFLGTGKREYSRVVNTQKCIRAGGKHNDLEEVGIDGYHHTFFEMLGNWSFGDYYKKEAINWAWELLTDVWKLPKNKLWATVFRTDDEAFNYWKSETDIPESHILRFDEKDNFWEMGETGPCGPCSEIHIDLTENGCTENDINAGLEEVIEIWNLVFIQYNRDEKGILTELPSKHIDTGMGFERIVRVLQNKKSNYETDLFLPIINHISRITGKEYTGENISSINAIADHIRALTFAISDGAIPSNEGRGYVLRRILRRASRLARKLDFTEPFLYKLIDTVVGNFSEIFPEIKDKKIYAENVIKSEEEGFNKTLDKGLELFEEIYERIKDKTDNIFPGDAAFKLYDTYGFPLDLTEVLAREKRLRVDVNIFESEMYKQKERARTARKEDLIKTNTNLFETDLINKKYKPEYNPYNLNQEGTKTEILEIKKTNDPETDILILKSNPFYSEAGGQISDTGNIILLNGEKIEVIESKNEHYIIVKNPDKRNISDMQIIAQVDYKRRKNIQRNHSATHLVHEALRQVLGTHVKQMGSLVSNEYLRFDFPHFQKVSKDEIKRIEDIINSKIQEKIKVETVENIDIEKANNIRNVKKIFGEKYGSKVRVVVIDENFSVEFCGGTHVINTEDIGLFKIIKEESISSGTRRIFAKTGEGILDLLNNNIFTIENIIKEFPINYSEKFIIGIDNLRKDINDLDFGNIDIIKNIMQNQNQMIDSLNELKLKLADEKKKAEKQLMRQRLDNIFNDLEVDIKRKESEKGCAIITKIIEISNTEEFKEAGEKLSEILKNGIVILAAIIDNKINLVCAVSDNLIKSKGLNAGKLISQIAKELGGGGGGKPHLAMAGGKDIEKLEKVLQDFVDILKLKVKN